MSDSETSIYSIDVVNEYLEGLEYQGDKISFDKFKKVYDGDTISEDGYKKVHEEFTEEDYLKFLNIKFDKYDCCYEEDAAEELYKILLFIYDQLDMSQEEFNKILEDMLIGYIKRGGFYEFSTSLLEKFYCESKFNFDINKFVIPVLEGLLVISKGDSNNFDIYSEDIIPYLKIHDANFDTDEVELMIKKFSDNSKFIIKSDQIKLNNLIKTRYKCLKCCSANK